MAIFGRYGLEGGGNSSGICKSAKMSNYVVSPIEITLHKPDTITTDPIIVLKKRKQITTRIFDTVWKGILSEDQEYIQVLKRDFGKNEFKDRYKVEAGQG